MQLTVEYLEKRHRFWVKRISCAGIWEENKFKDVELIVRNYSCSYEGLFHRKWIMTDNQWKPIDLIIIYQTYPELTLKEIDDTLVHEMIHQYIYQNNIPDTRIHGKIFKDFMQRINHAFPDELDITIFGYLNERKGPGTQLHNLIIVLENSSCIICKVASSKISYFTGFLERKKSLGTITDYKLCESNDMYFNTYTACRKRLYGVKMSLNEAKNIYRKCNLKPYDLRRI